MCRRAHCMICQLNLEKPSRRQNVICEQSWQVCYQWYKSSHSFPDFLNRCDFCYFGLRKSLTKGWVETRQWMGGEMATYQGRRVVGSGFYASEARRKKSPVPVGGDPACGTQYILRRRSWQSVSSTPLEMSANGTDRLPWFWLEWKYTPLSTSSLSPDLRMPAHTSSLPCEFTSLQKKSIGMQIGRQIAMQSNLCPRLL